VRATLDQEQSRGGLHGAVSCSCGDYTNTIANVRSAGGQSVCYRANICRNSEATAEVPTFAIGEERIAGDQVAAACEDLIIDDGDVPQRNVPRITDCTAESEHSTRDSVSGRALFSNSDCWRGADGAGGGGAGKNRHCVGAQRFPVWSDESGVRSRSCDRVVKRPAQVARR